MHHDNDDEPDVGLAWGVTFALVFLVLTVAAGFALVALARWLDAVLPQL
jgi:hypothetical protein